MAEPRATLRFGVFDGMDGRERRLWEAQKGCCGLCLKPLGGVMARGAIPADRNPTNLEHVWPRRLRTPDMLAAQLSGRPVYHGTHGNSVLAHARCNVAKGNRAPTGCEILVLHLVNAITGETPRETRWRPWRDPESNQTTALKGARESAG